MSLFSHRPGYGPDKRRPPDHAGHRSYKTSDIHTVTVTATDPFGGNLPE